MEPETILEVIGRLWPELPRYFGPAWVDVYPRLEAIIRQLEAAGTPAQRHQATDHLFSLLIGDENVRDRLRQELEGIEQEREGRGRGGEAPSRGVPWEEGSRQLAACVNPPFTTRYADITVPRQVALGRRAVVTVGLTRTADPESEAAVPLEVRLERFLEVYLAAKPQDFEVLGEPVRRLPITAGTDTEPAVFYIKGLSLGAKTLQLDFRQEGTSISVVQLVVAVTKETLTEEQVQLLLSNVTLGGPYTPPPDLDLRVMLGTRDGGITLNYVLHSPNGVAGYHYQSFPEVFLPHFATPQAYQEHVMRRMEKFGRGLDLDEQPLEPDQAEEKVKGVGRLLYAELLPRELQAEYRRFRDKVRTLQVTSDEPWIPWELLRPYDDSNVDDVIDDDFLCMRFEFTRWLAGSAGGAGKIIVKSLACVEAADAVPNRKLPYARAEAQYLGKLAQKTGVEDKGLSTATCQRVLDLLDRGRIGLWHFAAHGSVDASQPQMDEIVLHGGRLRAEDFQGPRQTAIARDRPLIFMNACRVGQEGWALTRLGGWATALVYRSHCGAFIGPLWSVDDRLAQAFAEEFYDGLKDHRTIAQAAKAARESLRRQSPHKPMFLAYSVYAQPNARVEFVRGLATG